MDFLCRNWFREDTRDAFVGNMKCTLTSTCPSMFSPLHSARLSLSSTVSVEGIQPATHNLLTGKQYCLSLYSNMHWGIWIICSRHQFLWDYALGCHPGNMVVYTKKEDMVGMRSEPREGVVVIILNNQSIPLNPLPHTMDSFFQILKHTALQLAIIIEKKNHIAKPPMIK